MKNEMYDLSSEGYRGYFVTPDFHIWSEHSNKFVSIDKTGCALLAASVGNYKRVSAKVLFSNKVIVPQLKDKGFKPIFDGHYYINMDGVVYSTRTASVLVETIFHKYSYVSCAGKYRLLHRLVAKTFIPNPNNLPEVNHIDGKKQNNKANNLEWCDRSSNMKHAYECGFLDDSLSKALAARLNRE